MSVEGQGLSKQGLQIHIRSWFTIAPERLTLDNAGPLVLPSFMLGFWSYIHMGQISGKHTYLQVLAMTFSSNSLWLTISSFWKPLFSIVPHVMSCFWP